MLYNKLKSTLCKFNSVVRNNTETLKLSIKQIAKLCHSHILVTTMYFQLCISRDPPSNPMIFDSRGLVCYILSCVFLKLQRKLKLTFSYSKFQLHSKSPTGVFCTSIFQVVLLQFYFPLSTIHCNRLTYQESKHLYRSYSRINFTHCQCRHSSL